MPTLCTRLTERDLDRQIAYKRMPLGCDQQGRIDVQPMAAEACTDIGADDDWHPPFTLTGIALILTPWAVGVFVIALASALI